MNIEQITQTLSTPGAVAVSLLWLHSRLNHVERCVESIAAKVEAPLPKKPKRGKSLLPLMAVALALAGSGCASIKQTATVETINEDGSWTTRTIESKMSALGDARSLADKLSVSQDKQAIGAEGAHTETSTTNSAAVFEALTRLIESVK